MAPALRHRQCLLQFGGHLGVFVGKDLRLVMDHGDLGAKTREHLRKFEADIAAAEHDQVAGPLRKLDDCLVGEIAGGSEAGNVRDVGARAGVDEDFLAFVRGAVDGDLVRTCEARVAAGEMQARPLCHLLLFSLAGMEHDFFLLRDDLRQIDSDVAGNHAPAVGVTGLVGHLGAMHHGFSRRAASVDAEIDAIVIGSGQSGSPLSTALADLG